MSGRDHLVAGLFAGLPAAALLLAALVAAGLDRVGRTSSRLRRGAALLGLSVALAIQLGGLLALQPGRSELLAAQGDASLDRFGILTGALVIALGLVTVLALPSPAARLSPHLGGHWAALLALTAGGTIACNSRAFPGLYAGVELTGVAGVILVGLDKRAPSATRGAGRLLVIGGVGSALALYGLALLLGLSGHPQVTDLARTLPRGALSAAALTLVLGGVLLKLAGGPLLIDSGESRGSITAATAAPLVSISALTGYAVAARVMAVAPAGVREPVAGGLAVVAALVLLVAAAGAVRARTVGALAGALAGTGIGLLLVALASTRATSGAITAGLLTAAALGGGLLALAAVPRPDAGAGVDLLRGLSQRSPHGGLLVACGVVILCGVPPLLGGVARAVLLESAILSGLGWLAVVAAFAWLLTLAAGLGALIAVYSVGDGPDVRERERHREGQSRWGLGLAGLLLATPVFLQPLTGFAGRAAAAILR